jgi:uncharacterized protein with GYD domain
LLAVRLTAALELVRDYRKEMLMPRYVVLYKFTDQGLKKIKDTVSRAAAVRKANEARGFKVIGTYWTEGHYDIVSIIESPDEASMTSGLFNIAQAGNVHSETLRAYNEAEMKRALAKPAAKRPARRRTASSRRPARRSA